jgi:hypothetical protein
LNPRVVAGLQTRDFTRRNDRRGQSESRGRAKAGPAVSARACGKRPFPTRFPTQVLKRHVGHPASVSPCSGGSLDPRVLFRGASLPAPFLMSRTTVTCKGHARLLSLFYFLFSNFCFHRGRPGRNDRDAKNAQDIRCVEGCATQRRFSELRRGHPRHSPPVLPFWAAPF